MFQKFYNNKKKAISIQMKKFSVDLFRSEFIGLVITGVRHEDARRSRDTGIAENRTERSERWRRYKRGLGTLVSVSNRMQ